MNTESDANPPEDPEEPPEDNAPDELDALLDRMSQAGDADAEAMLARVVARGGNVFAVRAQGDDPDLNEFLAQHSNLPEWARPELIAQGQDLFYRYGMQIVTLLFFHALPEGYACERPARILVRTGNMLRQDAVLHRILRTAQFLIDVMQPASLRPGGRGVRSAVQLRVLHAAVRYQLRGQSWTEGSVPISQEELAGTLGTFSVLMLDGLECFGCDFTEEEELAYIHVWNVVGYLMGIDEALLRPSRAESSAVFERVRQRIQAPCEESVELTRTLRLFLREMIPGTIFDGFVETMMREMLGPKMSEHLEIPECNWTQVFVSGLHQLSFWSDAAGDHSTLISRLFAKMHEYIIHGLMEYYQPGYDPSAGDAASSAGPKRAVDIPEDLRESWGVRAG